VIFEQAARKLGLPLGAILHVGDSASMDARGALAAGLQARLLDRRAAAAHEDRIRSLLDLPNLVALSETHENH
jgi:putative hydrolase of the HAD superfamily